MVKKGVMNEVCLTAPRSDIRSPRGGGDFQSLEK